MTKRAILPRARLLFASRGDEAGNVAIIFALALTAMLGCIGAAVDYARARNAYTTLQQAADAAALAAARSPDFGDAQAQQIATATFTANGTKPLITGTISSTVTRVGGSDPSVSVSLATTLPTTFAAVFGYTSMPIATTAKASLSLNYSVVYSVIDMSESMGLAADAAARTALNAVTAPYYAGGCNFGCHQRDGWEPGTKTVYQMAKENGIALREDVLDKAFGKLVDLYLDPSDPAVAANRRQMALYGFSDDATLLSAATNVASSVKAALPTFPDAKRLNTNYATSLATIRSQIGSQGNGTPANPRKTILLVTDGVAWIRSGPGARGPIDPALCTAIKSDGFTLAVVEVQYQDNTGEYWFDTSVAPFYGQISPGLQSCASPGYYFQATDSDATSLAKAFSDAANVLRSQLALTH